MARSGNQKLKLLYIAKYLMENTDETHPASTAELIRYLSLQNISAERKSIYDDVAALEDFGLDVVKSAGGGQHGWYVGSRRFELPELKLLVDSVQSANFITRSKSAALIGKIEKLASAHQARTLQRQVIVTNRIKAENEFILYNVDAIHEAINANRKIRFQYFDFVADKSKQYRRDGDFYEVSPFALTWDSENYYLIAHDARADAEQLRHYRVDRMERISMTDAAREGEALFRALDMATYTRQVFGMFSGELTEVQMRFDNALAGAVLDRFGHDVFLIPDGDGHFTLRTRVMISPRFFEWLNAFGTGAKLLGPAAAVEQLKEHLAALNSMYSV